MTQNIYGSRLKQARKIKNIPQDKLGILIGLDEHTASTRISRYENGVHEPAISTAQKISNILSIPLAFFYCDDDELAELILKYKTTDESI
jgi:transcriptional regulator with XRE-family HTH domain